MIICSIQRHIVAARHFVGGWYETWHLRRHAANRRALDESIRALNNGEGIPHPLIHGDRFDRLESMLQQFNGSPRSACVINREWLGGFMGGAHHYQTWNRLPPIDRCAQLINQLLCYHGERLP
jgi:hypothetical protein